MTDISSPPVGLRRTPRQARSRARVDAAITALLELVGEVERPTELTTADVAARAGIPLGSLYEYFEDLPAVVDAAVGRVLERHDELLLELRTSPPRTLRRLVDLLFDTYLQLYREQPGYLALRWSPLFERHHREWLTERVSSFIRDVAEHATALGVLVDRPDTIARLDLVFAMGDAVLQAALRDGGPGDPMMLDEGRAVLQYATRRVVNGLEGTP